MKVSHHSGLARLITIGIVIFLVDACLSLLDQFIRLHNPLYVSVTLIAWITFIIVLLLMIGRLHNWARWILVLTFVLIYLPALPNSLVYTEGNLVFSHIPTLAKLQYVCNLLNYGFYSVFCLYLFRTNVRAQFTKSSPHHVLRVLTIIISIFMLLCGLAIHLISLKVGEYVTFETGAPQMTAKAGAFLKKASQDELRTLEELVGFKLPPFVLMTRKDKSGDIFVLQFIANHDSQWQLDFLFVTNRKQPLTLTQMLAELDKREQRIYNTSPILKAIANSQSIFRWPQLEPRVLEEREWTLSGGATLNYRRAQVELFNRTEPAVWVELDVADKHVHILSHRNNFSNSKLIPDFDENKTRDYVEALIQLNT